MIMNSRKIKKKKKKKTNTQILRVDIFEALTKGLVDNVESVTDVSYGSSSKNIPLHSDPKPYHTIYSLSDRSLERE